MTFGRSISVVSRLTGYTLIGAGVALLFAVMAPFALGMRSLSVMSGSMEPAIATGDVIIDEWITPEEARIGDIVSFNDPTRKGIVLTHRVTKVEHRSDRIAFVTRGDANTGVERWDAPRGGRIGRVKFKVPRAGFLMSFTRSSGGRLVFLVLPAVLWGLYEIFRLWVPKKEVETDAAAA